MPSPTAFSIAVQSLADFEMPASIEDEYLVAPDTTGGWALAQFDGEHWYDIMSGEVLNPHLIATLPALRS